MEDTLAQMGSEKVVAVASTAEVLDNVLLHTQQVVAHTLFKLQRLPRMVALGNEGGCFSASGTQHLGEMIRDLQVQLYMIDRTRQKCTEDLELKFPKLAKRLFTHDYSPKGNFRVSWKIQKWSGHRSPPWSQLYDGGDHFSDSVSIPPTLQPYTPLRAEDLETTQVKSGPSSAGGWQDYLEQRRYSPPPPIEASIHPAGSISGSLVFFPPPRPPPPPPPPPSPPPPPPHLPLKHPLSNTHHPNQVYSATCPPHTVATCSHPIFTSIPPSPPPSPPPAPRNSALQNPCPIRINAI